MSTASNTPAATRAALAQPAPSTAGSRAAFDPSVWLRLPRPTQRCAVSGLSRSTLAELVRPGPRNGYAPPVDSRLVKRPGAARGVLLIRKQSLLDFLESQPAPARAEQKEGEK